MPFPSCSLEVCQALTVFPFQPDVSFWPLMHSQRIIHFYGCFSCSPLYRSHFQHRRKQQLKEERAASLHFTAAQALGGCPWLWDPAPGSRGWFPRGSAWGCGAGEPPGQGNGCAQRCLPGALTHLVLSQHPAGVTGTQPCHALGTASPPGQPQGVASSHFSLPCSKTKENLSGVNPCWVLN